MINSVVVFCSSSNDVSPQFFTEIESFGRMLAKNKIRIVYGGAQLGLMGRLADSALAAGGEVIGVIPEYLAQPNIVHNGLTELIIVSDLLDRKRKMLSFAQAAVACPGGIGTIDEITEVLALKQLNEHAKPVLFYNFLNFWDPLLDYFDELRARHMIHQPAEELYASYDSAEAIIEALK